MNNFLDKLFYIPLDFFAFIVYLAIDVGDDPDSFFNDLFDDDQEGDE